MQNKSTNRKAKMSDEYKGGPDENKGNNMDIEGNDIPMEVDPISEEEPAPVYSLSSPRHSRRRPISIPSSPEFEIYNNNNRPRNRAVQRIRYIPSSPLTLNFGDESSEQVTIENLSDHTRQQTETINRLSAELLQLRTIQEDGNRGLANARQEMAQRDEYIRQMKRYMVKLRTDIQHLIQANEVLYANVERCGSLLEHDTNELEARTLALTNCQSETARLENEIADLREVIQQMSNNQGLDFMSRNKE